MGSTLGLRRQAAIVAWTCPAGQGLDSGGGVGRVLVRLAGVPGGVGTGSGFWS